MQCFRVGYRGICHVASLVFSLYTRAFRKMFGNLRKCSEIIGKLRKWLKSVFQMILCFFKFSENLRESSEVFGNVRKFSENFGNGPKVIFRRFYGFLKFSENLRKSSEVFGNLRKISGRDWKCS